MNSIPFWLLIAAFSLASTTQNALAAEEGRPAAKEESPPASKAAPPGFLGRIITLDGKTYEKVTLEKVDPDGLLVTYVPTGGGSGSAKLKFRNLPAELQERFGYNPAQASHYEAARARGEAVWRAESALWTEQRWAAQAEEANRERQMRAQAEMRLAAEAEQARIEAARNAEQTAYYYPTGLWPANYYSPYYYSTPHHLGGTFRHNYMSQGVPGVGYTRSPVSPSIGPIGPMRPSGR